MPRAILSLLLLVCAVLCPGGLGAQDLPAPALAPIPKWVDLRPPPEPGAISEDDRKHGVVYRLIDRQINTATGEEFHRRIYTITSKDGVQNRSQVRMTWEPGYQTAVVHAVKLIRDGRPREARPTEKFQTMRREQSLQRYVLDGTLSAVAILEAVEVGDTIEFSWSVKGNNPVFGGLFARTLPLQLESRVERMSYRLLHDPKRKIAHRTRGKEPSYTTGRSGALIEHRWVAEGVVAPVIDEGAPSWWPFYGFLELSEYPAWTDVVKWGRQLFQSKSAFGPELKAKLAEIRSSGADAEEQINRTVALVQDQVRYLSVAIGEGTHRPSDPEETFRRRYGDCKDKSLLLAALLRDLGHDAAPALVDSDGGVFLNEVLPSPLAFDHAIVRLRFGGATYWIDATASQQGTALATRHVADYRIALVLAEGESGLVPVVRGRAAESRSDVRDVITSPSFDAPAEMVSTYTYSGRRAEGVRSYFEENDRAEIARRSLQFVRRYYPGATEVEPPSWSDDRVLNQLVVVERYRLPDFWKKDEKGVRSAGLHPTLLYTNLSKTGATKRTSPLALAFPQVLKHRVEITLPEDWQPHEKKEKVAHPAFAAERSETIQGKSAVIEYRYASLKDCVETGEVADYAKKLAGFIDDLGMTLTYGGNKPASAEADEPLPRLLSFLVWLGAAIPTGLVVFFACRRPPSRSRLYRAAEIEPRLQGLRGWLILPGIMLHVLALVGLMGFFISISSAHEAIMWTRFAAPSSPEYEPAYAEFAYSELVLLGVISALAISAPFLFWKRHHRLPAVMIALYALSFAWSIHTLAFLSFVRYPTPEMRRESNRNAARGFSADLIWGLYFFRSRRVAATFVRGGRRAPEDGPPPIPATKEVAG